MILLIGLISFIVFILISNFYVWKTYTNKYAGYSIQYPRWMNIDENIYFMGDGGVADEPNGTPPINNCVSLRGGKKIFLTVYKYGNDSPCGGLPTGGFDFYREDILSKKEINSKNSKFTVTESLYLFKNEESKIGIVARGDAFGVSYLGSVSDSSRDKELFYKIIETISVDDTKQLTVMVTL